MKKTNLFSKFNFAIFTVFAILSLTFFVSCPSGNNPEKPTDFPDPPANLYDYKMLGAEWETGNTVEFSVFAPTAKKVVVKVYDKSDISMEMDEYGIWTATATEIPVGTKYRFSVDGKTASDPYGKAWSWEDYSNCGWSIVVNPKEYEWEDSAWEIPSIDELVIYEMHLKDFTSHNTSEKIGVSNEDNRGKYAGIIDAVDYFTDLGINAIEFMPISEFNDAGYSWGYMTQSFFAPESGYAIERELFNDEPYPTGSQVKEFQELVDVLHQKDIAVIIDMVYNHVGNDQNTFWFIDNIYYFDPIGTPWGNRFDTKKPMVKKLIYDNMRYFIEEFHIDGFRLDATDFMDHNAVKEVIKELNKDFPKVIFIAEQLPNSSSFKGTGIAQWSDPFHDGIKALMRMGQFEGSKYNSDNLGKMTYYTKDDDWSASPKETINYMESHDENSVLHEVLTKTGNTKDDAFAATKLGALHMFTSLGTPMIMAGQEFFRNREGQDTDEKNGQINWSWKDGSEITYKNEKETYNYYQALIKLRLAHPELRMTDVDPAENGHFRWSLTPGDWKGINYPITNAGDLIIGYALNVKGTKGDYRWVVAINYSKSNKTLDIQFPANGDWLLIANGDEVTTFASPIATVTVSGGKANYTLPARTGLLFAQSVN